MKLIDTRLVDGPVAWSGPTISGFGDAAVKIRWIDKPYQWHRNDGREFFLVLAGTVEMHMRLDGAPSSVLLEAGQSLVVEAGEEHVAVPREPSRVLVVET